MMVLSLLFYRNILVSREGIIWVAMKVDVVGLNMYMMVKESEQQSTHTIAGPANSLHTMGMLDSSESFY